MIGVLGNGLFGAGMRTVQDRETNVLRRFKVAPITPWPLLVSSVVSGLVSYVPTLLLYFLISIFAYRMPAPANSLSMLVFVCLAVVAFRTLGADHRGGGELGSAKRRWWCRLLYLPMLFLSGATFPVSIMPMWLQVVAGFLPATYLFSGIQSMLIRGESIFR